MDSTLEYDVVRNAGAGLPPRGGRRGFSVRTLLAILAAVTLASFAAPADRAMAQTVNIPDPVLRERLNAALGRASAPDTPITRAEMAALATGGARRLSLSRPAGERNDPDRAIRDLTGLEYLTGIYVLFLSYNEISDLSPLAGLTSLATLGLNYNRVSDLSPLARLTNLRTLNLHYNRVSDLSPLAGLTSLDNLGLNGNRVSDLSPLARLANLRYLTANYNRISDLSPLARLTLTNLFLNNNQITDLGPLRNMNSLAYLTITSNALIRDLSPLSGLTGLDRLSVDGTGIEDLSPLVASPGFQAAYARIDIRDLANLNADVARQVLALRARGIRVIPDQFPLTLNRVVNRIVRGVSVTPGVRQLRVAWEPLPGYNHQGYTVYWRSEGSQLFVITATPPRHEVVMGAGTTTYTIPDLTPGVEYDIVIRAYGGTTPPGTPPQSQMVHGTPLAAPSVTVTPGVESLIVSWDPVDGADGYKVQWKSDEQGGEYDPETREARVMGAETSTYTIPDLTPGVEYTVRVIFTRTDEPDGEPSEEATGTPVGVVIDDVTVMEGDVAEFPVRLTEPSTDLLTLAWTTEDVTAKAGEDYRAVESGRLTFRRGEQEKTLRVQTLEDRTGEAAETFRIRLTTASDADPPAAGDPETGAVTATGTITDDDADMRARAMSMALAGMGRWVAADAMDVVEGRFAGSQAAEAQVGLGGRTLPLAGAGAQGPTGAAAPGTRFARYGLDPGRPQGPVRADEGWRWTPEDSRTAFSADSLARSRFNLPLGRQVDGAAPGGASGWRIWGKGSVGGFDDEPAAGSTIDGKVVAGYLGLDYRPRQDAMVGVALAHSRGDVDYAMESVTSGQVDMDLTSVLPYAHWSPRDGLGTWGLLGAGWGRAELQDEGGRVETDLRMWMAAVGLRQDVASWREIDLALKADGFLTELKTGAKPGLPKAKGEARRLRLRLEGSSEWEVSPVSRMTPRLELGGRWDGGTGEDGMGMEVGGGLAYTHTDLGLEVEARGRFLLAHQADGFEEWGGSLTVKLDPGQAGRGPWMTFSPGWGREGSRTAQMWDGKEAFRAHRSADGAPELPPDRLSLEVGWGLPTHGGEGLLTPYAGFSMSGSETRGYRMGARMKRGSRMSMGLQGRQWKTAQDAQPDYEVLLTAAWNW